MTTKEEEYKLASSYQNAFRLTVQSCMDGNLDDFRTNFVNLFNLQCENHPNCLKSEFLSEFHSEGKTLFHIACSSGKVEIVDYLLAQCSEEKEDIRKMINLKDNQGFTPLLNATIAESNEIMTKLISLGANINEKNNDGLTALHFASGDGNVERMKLLVSAGASVNEKSLKSGSPLHWAASKGHSEAIQYLLNTGEIDVTSLENNYEGVPAVILAAVASNDPSVVLLIQAGVDIGPILTGNLTLLHICAEYGLIESVKAMIAKETGSWRVFLLS
jgi:26S proteasome non-ATPase regulatory subunit 10